MKIPGVGKGQPTDADFQKVGEMCLGATKASMIGCVKRPGAVTAMPSASVSPPTGSEA